MCIAYTGSVYDKNRILSVILLSSSNFVTYNTLWHISSIVGSNRNQSRMQRVIVAIVLISVVTSIIVRNILLVFIDHIVIDAHRSGLQSLALPGSFSIRT
jgi:hypothetical protein